MNILLTTIRKSTSLCIDNLRRFLVLAVMSLTFLCTNPVLGMGPLSYDAEGWSDYIPTVWQEDIIMPSLSATLSIVSITPAASGVPGNSDVELSYTVKNDGMDSISSLQLIFDIADQIGTPPFIALTGSLSALTGSGISFNSGMPIAGSGSSMGQGLDLNSVLNPTFDGAGDDSLFSIRPILAPDGCITITFPIEIGDTTGFNTISLTAEASGTSTEDGTEVNVTTDPVVLVQGCQNVSLACAGQVNVTLGVDCTAEIDVSTVFLNTVEDPTRFSIELFDGTTSLGTTLDESHVGLEITYRVFDGCFGEDANCWGIINLENKIIPSRTTTFREIVCGQDPPGLATLSEIISQRNAICSIELMDFEESFITSGDRCGDGLIRRVITAAYNLEGQTVRDTVHIDSIVERVIELPVVVCPIGGPDIDDAINLNCNDVDGVPSPSFIAAYFNEQLGSSTAGLAYAYPHLQNGTATTLVITQRDTIIETIRDTTIILDGTMVTVPLIEKDTITRNDTAFVVEELFVPLNAGTTCNTTTTFSDEFFGGCAGPESKILRTWNILNWCTGDVRICEQWIVILDDEAPSITLQDTIQVGIAPWVCTAELELTAIVTDNCSDIRNMNWSSSSGVIGDDLVLREIGIGDSPVLVSLQVLDECGNDTVALMVVNVIDDIPPVAVARDQINTQVSFDPVENRGIVSISAESLDQGSNDSDCGPVQICTLLDEELQNPIRDSIGQQVTDALGNLLYVAAQCEVDGVFRGIPYVICKEAVKLCCDQVGVHSVALVVNDFSDLSGPSFASTLVTVEDKSAPIVTCEDVTVSCGVSIAPEDIGFPTVSGGVCSQAMLDFVDDGEVSDCGEGTITRFWTVDGDTLCTQLITITSDIPLFDPNTIKWPRHFNNLVEEGVSRVCEQDTIREVVSMVPMGGTFVCSEDLIIEPSFCDASCGLLTSTFEDRNLASGEACRNIIRQWIVIDWCSFDANSDDPDVDVGDTFEAVNDEGLDLDNARADLRDGDLCEECDEKSIPHAEDIYFRYTSVDLDGFYTFEQVIQIVDETPPVVDAPRELEVEISSGATAKGDDFDDCIGTTQVTGVALDLCGNTLLQFADAQWMINIVDEEDNVLSTINATGDTVTISVTGVANTSLFVAWEVSDGCGNIGRDTTEVIFRDIVAPTPICITNLTTSTTNADGTAIVWASDYDIGSFDNCSDPKFSFLDRDGISSPNFIFTCADIPNGISAIRQLELLVSDDAGNTSICNVSILLSDGADVCADSAVGTASISGLVRTMEGEMIEDVRVSLNGRENEITDVNGAYAFTDQPLLSAYRIEGNLNTEHLNGVSTLDLVLIQRHILGLDQFTDSPDFIAADVNDDGRISAVDLVQIRRLILGFTDVFEFNTSWRFLDPNQEFDDPTFPFPFIEELLIPSLQRDTEDQDLIGIKIGDVNGNAVANSLLSSSRSRESVNLHASSRFVEKDEVAEVPFTLSDISSLTGMQFSIKAEEAEILDISSSMIDLNSDYTRRVSNHEIAVAWSTSQAIQSGELFTVTIKANKPGRIEDLLRLDQSRIEAEVYDDRFEEYDISLVYNGESSLVETYELYQNRPNPFSGETVVKFDLREAGDATFTIWDISGKALYTRTQNYSRGSHAISVSSDELGANGVLYYQLTSKNLPQTKRII